MATTDRPTEHFSYRGNQLRAEGFHDPDSIELPELTEAASPLLDLFNKLRASIDAAPCDTVVEAPVCRTCNGSRIVHLVQDSGTGGYDVIAGEGEGGNSGPCPDCSPEEEPPCCDFCGTKLHAGTENSLCPSCLVRGAVRNPSRQVLVASRCVIEALVIIRAPRVPFELVACSARRVIFAERAEVRS